MFDDQQILNRFHILYLPEVCRPFSVLLLRLTFEVYSKISPMIFIDGSGGKMYVFRTMNSFKISFCIVPVSSACFAPCKIRNGTNKITLRLTWVKAQNFKNPEL